MKRHKFGKIKARIFFNQDNTWEIRIPDPPKTFRPKCWKSIGNKSTIDSSIEFCEDKNLDWKIIG